MKIAIIGSRNVKAPKAVFNQMAAELPGNCTEIISCGAEGVDKLAEKFAKEKINELECLLKKMLDEIVVCRDGIASLKEQIEIYKNEQTLSNNVFSNNLKDVVDNHFRVLLFFCVFIVAH